MLAVYAVCSQTGPGAGFGIETVGNLNGLSGPKQDDIQPDSVDAFVCCAVSVLAGCGDGTWNSLYPAAEQDQNTFYSSFSLRPKHLDPAQSYSFNEVIFTGQIYEPPLQYHYLKRPYTLIPLTATDLPHLYFEDAQGQRLPDDVSPAQIAFSVYEIHIQPGIR